MAISVLFPDGSVRQVVGELKLDLTVPGGRFVQHPINCDPQWKFVKVGGLWLARRRRVVRSNLPVMERTAWWDAIPQMAEGVTASFIGPQHQAA